MSNLLILGGLAVLGAAAAYGLSQSDAPATPHAPSKPSPPAPPAPPPPGDVPRRPAVNETVHLIAHSARAAAQHLLLLRPAGLAVAQAMRSDPYYSLGELVALRGLLQTRAASNPQVDSILTNLSRIITARRALCAPGGGWAAAGPYVSTVQHLCNDGDYGRFADAVNGAPVPAVRNSVPGVAS